MSFLGFVLLLVAFAVALFGAFAGLYFHELPRAARLIIPFSGGLLVGVALFGLLPELTAEIGLLRGLPVFTAGFLLLFWLDRLFHGHIHNDVRHAMAGFTEDFTWPLFIAAAMHSFLDGWGLESLAGGQSNGVLFIRLAFPVAVMLHKAPEGLALGAIFRATTGKRWTAFLCCLGAEAMTFMGGWAGSALTPRLGSAWTNYPLALAGGCFLYLGYHAVEGEWLSRGARAVWVPAAAGLALAGVVQVVGRMVG